MASPPRRYLFDASALINVYKDGLRARQLTSLAKSGKLRVPKRVAKEIRRRDDRLKSWVNNHPEAVITETNENTAQLERIMREYSQELGTSRRSADHVIVAMGLHYREQRVVVTDDAGIQAACFREDLRFLPFQAFRHVESV